MTKERAQHILKTRTECQGFRYAFMNPFMNPKYASLTEIKLDGITELEDRYIRDVWSLMGVDKSYFNAVEEIAKGV